MGGAGVSPADAWVSRVQEGVTETQIIVLSSDVEFVPDVQSVHVVCASDSVACEFAFQLDGGTDYTTALRAITAGGAGAPRSRRRRSRSSRPSRSSTASTTSS